MKVRKLKPDELQHHGIKGQRWGVRRFQNYDGTLINKKGGQNTYAGSGAGVNDPRAKKWNKDGKNSTTTGKSKGVKRRGDGLGTGPVGNSGKSRTDGDYAKWLQNQHSKKRVSFGKKSTLGSDMGVDGYLTHDDYNGNTGISAGYRFNVNPKLKDNQIGCVITTSKDGYDIYNFEFKDKESAAKFLKTQSGDAIFSSAPGLMAIGDQAYQKGYLEYDENFANSAQGGTAPFACFNNLSDEEKLDPTMTDKSKKQITEEEYEKQRQEQQGGNQQNSGNGKKITKSEVIKTAVKELAKAVADTNTWTTGALSAVGKAYVNASNFIHENVHENVTITSYSNKNKKG